MVQTHMKETGTIAALDTFIFLDRFQQAYRRNSARLEY
jgi:hypothetical protein